MMMDSDEDQEDEFLRPQPPLTSTPRLSTVASQDLSDISTSTDDCQLENVSSVTESGDDTEDYVGTESAATAVPRVEDLQNKCFLCAGDILEPLKHHNSSEAVAVNIQNVYR